VVDQALGPRGAREVALDQRARRSLVERMPRAGELPRIL